jgi:hypothetical protein
MCTACITPCQHNTCVYCFSYVAHLPAGGLHARPLLLCTCCMQLPCCFHNVHQQQHLALSIALKQQTGRQQTQDAADEADTAAAAERMCACVQA